MSVKISKCDKHEPAVSHSENSLSLFWRWKNNNIQQTKEREFWRFYEYSSTFLLVNEGRDVSGKKYVANNDVYLNESLRCSNHERIGSFQVLRWKTKGHSTRRMVLLLHCGVDRARRCKHLSESQRRQRRHPFSLLLLLSVQTKQQFTYDVRCHIHRTYISESRRRQKQTSIFFLFFFSVQKKKTTIF